MKTKEAPNALKALTEEELNQAAGGLAPLEDIDEPDYTVEWKKTGDEVEPPMNVGDYTAKIT